MTFHHGNRQHRRCLCARRCHVTEVEFATLRATLGVADSVTSKHLRVLRDAGYVMLTKPTGRVRSRAHT